MTEQSTVRDEELAQLRYERDQLRGALATVTGQCRGLEGQLVAARSTIDRVRAVADNLASHGRLGVDLEADGIRRAIAGQLHAALKEPVVPGPVTAHPYQGDGHLHPCTAPGYGTCGRSEYDHETADPAVRVNGEA